jgi:hypothetical protein
MADFSKYTGRSQAEDAQRAQLQEEHLRPQAERERAPGQFQKTQERERTDSSWSGSSMGGGTWAGRSR